jgi:ankyrin repeat protein
MSNQVAVVKLLLDLGANMLSVDTNGYYPVQHAAHKGHEAVVKLFLDKGYAPNEMSWDTYEPSALHSAVYGGHPDVARLLLDHGADPSLKGAPSQPYPDPPAPLDVALLKIGTKLPWHRRKYSHPIGEGIPGGREKCALLLIERGARLTTSDGASPYLMLAVQGNFIEVVQVLLALGLDPNDDSCGQTALGLANRHKYPELIELLEPLTSPVAKGKRKRRKIKS